MNVSQHCLENETPVLNDSAQGVVSGCFIYFGIVMNGQRSEIFATLFARQKLVLRVFAPSAAAHKAC